MKQALEKYRKELEAIREAGTWKGERVITTPQRARIDTTEARMVVNMCANNYLGLSNHPALGITRSEPRFSVRHPVEKRYTPFSTKAKASSLRRASVV